jgi:hypothetical protein
MTQFGNDHASDGLGDKTRRLEGEHYNNKLDQVADQPSLTVELLELRLTKSAKKLAQAIAYPPDGTYPTNLAHVVSCIQHWCDVLVLTVERSPRPTSKYIKQLTDAVINVVQLERECSSNDYAESLYQLRKQLKRI